MERKNFLYSLSYKRILGTILTIGAIIFLSNCGGDEDTTSTGCSPSCGLGQICENGTCVTDPNWNFPGGNEGEDTGNDTGGDANEGEGEDAEIKDGSTGDGSKEDVEGDDSGQEDTGDGGEGNDAEDVGEEDTGVPSCPAICKLDHAKEAACDPQVGECVVVKCESGYYNLNEDQTDGCEYHCNITNAGIDICGDNIDNDCNGTPDDGELLKHDPQNCGQCNKVCPGYGQDYTIVDCKDSTCTFACTVGHYDHNADPSDGCESTQCKPTGDEVCDAIDNDCDGLIDEDFDTSSSSSCGPGCVNCTTLFGQFTEVECVGGECIFAGCQSGHSNLDGDLSNGCEAGCVPTTPPDEICDTVDNDCNSATVDGKADPLFEQPCTVPYAKGACTTGKYVCQYGFMKCVSTVQSTSELCDNIDNDCDGEVDDSVTDCTSSQSCINGTCTNVCTPNCSGKECGDNGCGGRCAECTVNYVCVDFHCIPNTSCTPDCSGKVCGDDSCGGQCTPGCAITEICNSLGQCVTSCSPLCSGKQCGPDGCSGTCPPGCSGNQTCNSSGQCVTQCVPNCTGKQCGSDGCGGTCPPGCSSDQTCDNGTCITPPPPAGMDSVKLVMSYNLVDGNTCHSLTCSDARNVDMVIKGTSQTCPPYFSYPSTNPEVNCSGEQARENENIVLQYYIPTTTYDGTYEVYLAYVEDCYKKENGKDKCWESRSIGSNEGAKVDLLVNSVFVGSRNFSLRSEGDTILVMRLHRTNGYFTLDSSP